MTNVFDKVKFENSLKAFLDRSTPANRESYHYATLPTGKLFRANIVYALAHDLEISIDKNLEKLAIAIELHHAYSLVHDDLPCMDDDDFRRGKPSCHKKFNEWIAVLTGDGLLNSSYKSLIEINHDNLSQLLKLFTWACGSKGLIEGQYQDLEGQNSIENTLRVHELKTGRLFQVCTLGTNLLKKNHKNNLRSSIDFLKLGSCLGILFQLLDDLDELTDHNVSHQELEINPFNKNKQWAMQKLEHYISSHQNLVQKYKLNNFQKLVAGYVQKCIKNVSEHEALLKEKYVIETEKELLPLMLKLNI